MMNVRVLMMILFMALVAGCGRSGSVEAEPAGDGEGPIKVVVTVPPLAWAVEVLELNGVNAQITVLLPAGASPHGWEPSPSDALALAEADVVLVAGIEDRSAIEPLLEGDDAVVVSMQEVLTAPDVTDNHPWLNKWAMLRFVHSLHETLGVLGIPDHPDPRSWPYFLPRSQPPLVLTGHDAWGAFFEEMNAEVLPLRHDHHDEPTAAHLAEIRTRAIAAERVLVVLDPHEDEPWLRDLAEEVGAATVVLDPVGTRDWLGDMKKRYEAVEAALDSLE